MGEHNYTGFRRCEGEKGCDGLGFQRVGSIAAGGCVYVACRQCGGSGQFYIENRSLPVPATDLKAATASLQAQRAANAAQAGTGVLSVETTEGTPA